MTAEDPLLERYECLPICRLSLVLSALTAAIGPAGDDLYIPLRIEGGSLAGIGAVRNVLGGSDFAVMHADEKLEHHGALVAADPAGDILVWYEGTTSACAGAYDDVIDGRLPGSSPCVLSVRVCSTNAHWRSLNRVPLLGTGTFDGGAGHLDLTISKTLKS